MKLPSLSRRSLLLGAAAALPVAALPGRLWADTPRLYLSARGDGAGGYRATAVRASGGVAFDIPLPARGHSMAVRPGGAEAVYFGRRPGAFAMVADIAQGRQARLIDAAAGRWFNGHGVFTPAGDRLFTSETVGATGDGMIGVYDPADGYRRAGEFSSGGLDPHDIRLLGDGRTLVVPNGGILQLNDAPRTKLNIPTMQPSLAYFDARHAQPLAKITLSPDLHQLSIRHLSVRPDDSVAIAMQYEGPSGDSVPLVGLHAPGETKVRLLGPPAEVVRRLRQYCGSAAIDSAGRILGVTSPRGGVSVFWDLADGRFLGSHRMPDCCGIAPADGAGRFLISSGHGVLRRFDARSMRGEDVAAAPLATAQWDNHMLAVAAAV